ncbi:MAG: PIG-L family deacetylase, partial [Ferruginibacter sp.]
MKSIISKLLLLVLFPNLLIAQNKNSSDEIYQQIKKLSVHANVLYIAAHPDDENTKLLAYLANEKLYNTAYLSLTRGDGGQNLIGDEQGIDLGLIRTNELLEARKVDGATQFFSRAYDFGFSKSPEEALRIWGHDKILSDVVWTIRKFRPDIIICRFPTTGEGGHGHHTASAILASEAFDAAANPAMFPEQFTNGVTVWQAQRLLWNTFNFGSTNTQNENQFKVDCGGYNPVLGKSYGEISATSRSMHSSQGFGVPASRGSSVEYFTTIKGIPPIIDLMDNVDVTFNRLQIKNQEQHKQYDVLLKSLIDNFKINSPQSSILDLQKLLQLNIQFGSSPMHIQKRKEIEDLILKCSGIFMEGVSKTQNNIIGDSLFINLTFNNRLGLAVTDIKTGFIFDSIKYNEINLADKAASNININKPFSGVANPAIKESQPFWLKYKKEAGSFTIPEQADRVLPIMQDSKVYFSFKLNGEEYTFEKPLEYKYIDPVKGEIYQPSIFTNPIDIKSGTSLIIKKNQNDKLQRINYNVRFNKAFKNKLQFYIQFGETSRLVLDTFITKNAGENLSIDVDIPSSTKKELSVYGWLTSQEFSNLRAKNIQSSTLKKISYSHIPDIFYHYTDSIKILYLDIKTTGKNIGYIVGAGDKVPEALK